MRYILPDNSVVSGCISSFPILKEELEFVLLSVGKYYYTTTNIIFLYKGLFLRSHVWVPADLLVSYAFPSLHIFYSTILVFLPYLFPHLATFHFDFLCSISFYPFTPFLHILSVSQTLSSCAFYLWWTDCINGLHQWPPCVYTLCLVTFGPFSLGLWLSNMAKDDDSKREAKEKIENVFAYFHLFSGTLASSMIIYAVGLLKIWERHMEECFLWAEVIFDQVASNQPTT